MNQSNTKAQNIEATEKFFTIQNYSKMLVVRKNL